MIPPVRGYLALIDILGFSDLIRADEGLKAIGGYLDKLSVLGQRRGVEFVAFSDSIILTADGDSEESFLKIAATCSNLFLELLQVSIPIRGAITFGEYMRDDAGTTKSVFIAGKAVLDAYRYEKSQDWVGIMITPAALLRLNRDLVEAQCALPDLQRLASAGHLTYERVLELERRTQWAGVIQKCSSIPFHRELPSDPPNFDGYAIVPTDGDSHADAITHCIGQAVRDLHLLRALAPSPRAQLKYANTIKWLSDAHYIWWQLAQLKPAER